MEFSASRTGSLRSLVLRITKAVFPFLLIGVYLKLFGAYLKNSKTLVKLRIKNDGCLGNVHELAGYLLSANLITE